ncbi:MAG: phosphate ABC transporter permease PstA [Pseudomonadota bacterium]
MPTHEAETLTSSAETLDDGVRRAEPFVWLSAAAVVTAVLLLAGLVVLLAGNSLRFFWPQPVVFLNASSVGQAGLLGVVLRRETPRDSIQEQLLVLRGGQEFFSSPVEWISAQDIQSEERPRHAVTIERVDRGRLYGFLDALDVRGERISLAALPPEEALRLFLAALERSTSMSADQLRYRLRLSTGQIVERPVASVSSLHFANAMSWSEKAIYFLQAIGRFLTESPRQSNVEGGVLTAIVGTVMLVLLMTIVVAPLGVTAAIYLNEYARGGPVTRLVRIAVNNLAGVPSIVYGVFGLGFFVYAIGGSLDSVFFADRLPAPTLGTPGLLWASLTMALLTLPVVIVSTEEGLVRVPRTLREGSLALGATRAETVWRVVLPSALPAVLTGLILAIARATGEVAPLILVGVAKYAPGLPISAEFPYVHFDRQFMHLGFYIYDLGFQSPQLETVEGLVFATALLLVGIVLMLNLSAVILRGRLREAFSVEEGFR